MAAKLKVDTVQLASLGTKLGNIRDKLGNTGAQLTRYRSSLGASTVADALHQFEDHWGRGRRQLQEKADALASMLTDAATNYVKADADLESNLTTENTIVAPGTGGGHGAV